MRQRIHDYMDALDEMGGASEPFGGRAIAQYLIDNNPAFAGQDVVILSGSIGKEFHRVRRGDKGESLKLQLVGIPVGARRSDGKTPRVYMLNKDVLLPMDRLARARFVEVPSEPYRKGGKKNDRRPTRNPSESERLRKLNAQGWTCAGCGNPDDRDFAYVPDHIKAVAKDGGDELANFQMLCRACNERKGKLTTPDLWEMNMRDFMRNASAAQSAHYAALEVV